MLETSQQFHPCRHSSVLFPKECTECGPICSHSMRIAMSLVRTRAPIWLEAGESCYIPRQPSYYARERRLAGLHQAAHDLIATSEATSEARVADYPRTRVQPALPNKFVLVTIIQSHSDGSKQTNTITRPSALSTDTATIHGNGATTAFTPAVRLSGSASIPVEDGGTNSVGSGPPADAAGKGTSSSNLEKSLMPPLLVSKTVLPGPSPQVPSRFSHLSNVKRASLSSSPASLPQWYIYLLYYISFF
ncbi:hypothetical protein B0H63DRAFT_91285 [Podospora didyma]|uniref:Uncharacterized protein n=1 Tax=Podospora didyma TaxID=330526 RepID=A0AAE0N183_9PEZI|nr:hypothetical protein B0H63DRAFT_91285 [Podospora didyma]